MTHRPATPIGLAAAALLVAGCAAQDAGVYIPPRADRPALDPGETTFVSTAAAQPEEIGEPRDLLTPGVDWWDEDADSLFGTDAPLGLTLADVYGRALAHSNQIKVFGDVPLVRRQAVAEAEGLFTPRFFAEGKFERLNEPVGSTLQTGGPDRFKENSAVGELGVTQRLKTGGDVTVSQRLENVDNNSVFFVPDPQSRARLVVGLVQPLLKGAGARYNTGIVEIAKIDGAVAQQEMARQVEAHLAEVSRAYWNLYLARSVFKQQRRLTDETADVVRRLDARGRLDASGRLTLRARSELSRRRSELVRAESAVRNAEDRLRALLNDPELFTDAGAELVPAQGADLAEPDVDVEAVVEAALRDRPEVRQAMMQLDAAGIREAMARNEALPRLDLVAEASVSGLDGGDDLTDPLGKQLSDGGVSYVVGARFEVPLGTGPDQARHKRRRIERLQQASQLDVTLDTIRLEAMVSAREVRTAHRDLTSRRQSLADAREDYRLLSTRFEQGLGQAGDGGNVGAASFLEFLLDAQERVGAAEREYAESVATYNVSLVNLQRAQGSLLRYEDVDAEPIIDETARDGLPQLRIEPRQQH